MNQLDSCRHARWVRSWLLLLFWTSRMDESIRGQSFSDECPQLRRRLF